tara:strand:- start:87 stop:335 length:249 start_codon:yes stop_codon:yes gene_type:complete
VIELFVAVVNRFVKDLDHQSMGIRTQAMDYFLVEDEAFVANAKKFGMPYEWIRFEVENIVKEEGYRKKKLVENLSKKIREYA